MVIFIIENQDSSIRIVDSTLLPVHKFGRTKFRKTFRSYVQLMKTVFLKRRLISVINCTYIVLGDKGYTHKSLASRIKREKNIDLIPLKRENDKLQYFNTFWQLILKFRLKIETTASQLMGQLNIERISAKSL